MCSILNGTKLIFRLSDIFGDAASSKPVKHNVLAIVYDLVGYLQPITIQLQIIFLKNL